jgi:hypothetical protein
MGFVIEKPNRKAQRMHKLVAIVGGFIILAGMILLGVAALSFFGYLDVGMMLRDKYMLTFAIMLIIIGLLDAFAAIIIARW